MKLSDREWGEFRISDIFNQKRGKEPAPKQVSDYGKTPIVNEISTNNGIFKFGKGKYLINGNTITVSVNFAKNVFYQKCSFYASVNIIALCSQYLNEYVGKFFSTVICKSNILYNYSYKTSKDRLNTTKILLLTTPQGTPDYDFMEDYIKELMSKKRQKYIEYVKEKMEDLKTVVGWGCVLNDREWREFRIEELFNVSGTITTHPSVLIKGGNIPRITCSATNNGLDDFYKNTYTENGGVITVDSATVGFTSYQNYYFIATDHVEKIFFKNGKKMNYFCGLFIKQAIDSAVNKKYNYGYKFSQSRIKKQIILLPITQQGDPDYEFMENYTKRLIYNKLLKYLEYITKATKN